MRWSSLSNQQKAKLSMMASKSRREADNAGARQALRTSFEVQRDLDRAKAKAGIDEMRKALAVFTPSEQSMLATKLPAGEAFGAGMLNRKKSRALPMAPLGSWA